MNSELDERVREALASFNNNISDNVEESSSLDNMISSIRDEYNLTGSTEETAIEDDIVMDIPIRSEEPEETEVIGIPDMVSDEVINVMLNNTEAIIPPNSGSLLVDEKTSRFSGAAWYKAIKEKSVLLAGLGGIGSWVALLLGRLKISHLTLIDHDIVETGNLSGQLYSVNDLQSFKVDATASTLEKYADYHSYLCLNFRFDENSDSANIMICGFDNMSSRRIFFKSWKTRIANTFPGEEDQLLFIDARLAAEEFQVFCIRGDDTYNINRYEKEFLFDDYEADETICSYKQTSFCANMVASVIINLFVNFAANSLNPIMPRDLPFYTMYNAETMYFKTEA